MHSDGPGSKGGRPVLHVGQRACHRWGPRPDQLQCRRAGSSRTLASPGPGLLPQLLPPPLPTPRL